MTMKSLRKAVRYGSAALIFAGLLGASSLASAGGDDKKPAAKPAAPAKPASKPAGGSSSGGTSHGSTTGASTSHGPSANHPSGPSANHPSGPSANHPGGGTSTSHPGGPASTNHSGGPGGGSKPTAFNRPVPHGGADHTMRSGNAIRTRPGGRVSDVHDARRGMDIHHNLGGGRRVEVERADHSRVVFERGRPGYVQRGYA